MAWVETSCQSDCGKVWGDVGYCHRIQRPPNNPTISWAVTLHARPRSSLIFKVGYILCDDTMTEVCEERTKISLVLVPLSLVHVFGELRWRANERMTSCYGAIGHKKVCTVAYTIRRSNKQLKHVKAWLKDHQTR